MSLRFERLEDRRLLAVSVAAGSKLVIVGDGANDVVEINGTGIPGTVEVVVDLDGDEVAETTLGPFSGVKDIVFRGNDGNDTVTIDGVIVSGGLVVSGGSGDDVVTISGASIFGGNVNIETNSG
ncbi:MAG: hypothetical protein KDA75_11515, partial [Planctomycetaceae bacterium]|nr:hypothetical protein [Planctomycetaceae bacterium]